MRFVSKSFALLVLALVPARAGAEGIWNWTHQSSGSGTANVFDGGPPGVDQGAHS